jgi:anaerobic selenocysteine-containing dehydrogenase
MGYGQYFPWKTEEEAIDCELKPLGITFEQLMAHPKGIVIPIPPMLYKKFRGFFGGVIRRILKITLFRDYPEMYRKYEGFMKGFNTPSKKVEIYSERLEKLGYEPLPVYKEPAESPVSRPDLANEYPLILIAGSKLEMYTHSMMRNISGPREQYPENVLEINPKTAAKLNIEDGNVVTVESPRGGIKCMTKVTDTIDPRVVHLYHGFEGSNCNVLTDHQACDPITGSTGLKSLLCTVEPMQHLCAPVSDVHE